MSKFQVGDKVRVVNVKTTAGKEFVGITGTINRVFKSEVFEYELEIDNHPHFNLAGRISVDGDELERLEE